MTPVDRTTALPALPKLAGQANVPGLRRLWLVEDRHVLGVVDPRTQPGNLNCWKLPKGGLTLINGEAFPYVTLACRAALGTYNQRNVTGAQGIAWAQTVSITLPGDHPQTQLAIARLLGRRWVAVIQDANGLGRLISLPKYPLRFETAYGTNPSSHNLVGSTTTLQPALGFDEFWLFENAEAEFSYAFSDEFNS